MGLLELWIQGFLLIMGLLSVLWIVSVIKTNASIIDPFWGTGFVVLAGYYLFNANSYGPRAILVMTLVSIWGLRLSIFLLYRNIGHGEDYRYQQFRKDYGEKRYWWVSFFQVFLLQGLLMSIVALPLLTTMTTSSNPGLLDVLASLIWVIGFIFESVGDYQLHTFKKNPDNHGKVLNTGLWKYTRHPNYFGDAMIWWSFGIFGILDGNYWILIGPLIMNVLLLKISGVALLEKKLKTSKPQYQEYVSRTNAFFPWFPKSKA